MQIDPDEISDLIADIRALFDPSPAFTRHPTTSEIVHAAAVSGWLPPLSDPYLRPVLPGRYT